MLKTVSNGKFKHRREAALRKHTKNGNKRLLKQKKNEKGMDTNQALKKETWDT